MAASWFDFIGTLRPIDDSEMTSLVTAYSSVMTDAENSSVPLDWWVHVGGSIRERMEASLRKTADLGISIQLRMKPDPVLKFEIESWLHSHPSMLTNLILGPRSRAWANEIQIFQTLPVKPSLEVETPETWFARAGLPAALQDHVAEFLIDMENSGIDRNEPPWVFWSRLPGWLKRRNGKGLDVGVGKTDFAAMDLNLAFLRVALSPQDEVAERESLTPAQLMVNPTFEYSESQKSPLVALARNWDFVSHRSITSLEAQILDHVREAFRANRASVLTIVSGETGVRKEFVNAAIESLIADSFLLANRQDLSGALSQ